MLKDEAVAAKNNINAIQPAVNSTNPNVYGSFLTPTADIVSDYSGAGVTIAMVDPVLGNNSISGGYRRTMRRRRGARKMKKTGKKFRYI